ncbi:hypothetical protein [Serratia proteamaculans]|uniref:hypothetical protein n=1 Tax=Serratia proteamaculans TaxID=28151 RepID=UPI0029814DF4|nr:hypothetical protein [Serratia proteamaculans]MDW5512085.1 hypothetical protein [Serratia proteamaculans]
MKIKTKILVFFLAVTACVIFWKNMHKDKGFNCWARLHTLGNVENCKGKSVYDVFISLHSGGEGYILVSGEWSCKNSSPKTVDGIMNFSYIKQDDYYSIHMKERNPQLEAIFRVLTYRDIKLKVTAINSSDFVLTLPNETLMICTED